MAASPVDANAVAALLAAPLGNIGEAQALLLGLAAVTAGRRRSPASPGVVRTLLDQLGRPEAGRPAVQVVGSKGKGSTTLLLESILLAAGRRPLTFTSPHLERWTERIRVGGQELSETDFVSLLERVRVAALAYTGWPHSPGFFELVTTTAMLAAAELHADCLLVEAGMGGRCDASNVLTPRVACLTTVELEHADRLGGTLEAIAREKLGVVAPGTHLVTGELPAAAATEARRCASATGSALWRLGQEIRWRAVPEPDTDGGPTQRLEITLEGDELRLQLSAAGRHQAANAVLAVACARVSGLVQGHTLLQAARAGLVGARLPGRAEVLRARPWVVVDSAHTPASVAALSAMLSRIPARRRHLVLSLSGDRDPAVFAPLLRTAANVTLTRGDAQRGLPAAALAVRLPELPPGAVLHSLDSPAPAFETALAVLGADDLLCVTGSFYLAGTARRYFAAR